MCARSVCAHLHNAAQVDVHGRVLHDDVRDEPARLGGGGGRGGRGGAVARQASAQREVALVCALHRYHDLLLHLYYLKRINLLSRTYLCSFIYLHFIYI